jgi:iron complex outermembrane receptor protein
MDNLGKPPSGFPCATVQEKQEIQPSNRLTRQKTIKIGRHYVNKLGKRNAFLRTALLGSACLFATMTVVPAALAADEEALETVVVTGLRESLQRNLDIKREASGLVDAITMEDIGKFPDSNLAAAMMRIPGVTITRAGAMAGSGIATTGQATEVTVRGMGPSFNETLFNGRKIPSANGGRAFDFSGLSADMVAGLAVLKSPDATMSAGAIGATINVKYPNPFDKDGLTVAAAVSTSYGPNDGRFQPNGNFLVSNTFFGGKLGILVAGAYSKMSTTQVQVSNWGWIGSYINPCQRVGGPACPSNTPVTEVTGYDPTTGAAITSVVANPTAKQQSDADAAAFQSGKDTTKPIWFTQDLSYDYNQIREERKNARISVQLQPVDALLVTVDANYARDTVVENQYAFAIWNNGDEMRNVKTSANGTIVDFTRAAPTDFDDNINMGVQQTYDVGINVKYTASDKLSFMLDYDMALSSLNPGDNHWSGMSANIGYGPSAAGGTNGTTFEVIQPGNHMLPYYKGLGPNGDASRFADTSIMGSHVTTTSATRNRNAVNQVKAEVDWTEDSVALKFGGQYVTDHYHMAYWGPWESNRWQAWSGYGPDSNNPTGVHLPADLFHGNVNLSAMPGWDSSNAIPYLLRFYQKDVWAYLNSLPTTTPGFNSKCCDWNKYPYGGVTPGAINSFAAGSFQQVFEDTYAVYTTASTETKFAGMPLKVNAGVRYEYTDVKSMGIDQPLIGLDISSGDVTAYKYTMGDSTNTSRKNSYQYLLPNLDLILQVTDDFQLRFDASRTLTRPNLNDLKPNKSNWGGRKGSLGVSGGNPEELPFTSDNVDVSAEWYYAANSYLSADVFFKNISNFVVTGTSNLTLDGKDGRAPYTVIDPNTGTYALFTLTQPTNGPTADVYGIELAWQHMIGDTGLGYAMNGTIVQSDTPYNPDNLNTNAFAITGLADSANFVAFYDKYGFEFRFAANWRDTYLDHFGQGQSSGTKFGSEPVFVNGVWTLDASTSYDVTENINVYFEANNLMNVAYSTRGRYSDQVLDVVSTGRSFTAGVHFRL